MDFNCFQKVTETTWTGCLGMYNLLQMRPAFEAWGPKAKQDLTESQLSPFCYLMESIIYQ